jgi:hypothetical protein
MNPPDQPTQPTEAHKELAEKIRHIHFLSGFPQLVAQLLADSEARAVAEATKHEVETSCARLRADLERFTGHGLLDCHAICDQRDAATAERDRLRAEVERWELAFQEQYARAEKAEAALAFIAQNGGTKHETECGTISCNGSWCAEQARAAIDAAMKGTP